MKRRIGILAAPALLAMLLVSMTVMPAMAQDEMNQENTGLDVVDAARWNALRAGQNISI